MNETGRCPQCEAELPANAPEGLCPRCLMKQALGTEPPVAAGGTGSDAATGPVPWQATFTPPEPSELAASFPQLEVMDILGQGGMGVLYRARQVGLDRVVALKILPPEAAADPAFAERFTREARALARLSHPNIVTVYDSGQASLAQPDGPAVPLYYFLMEYIDGVNLREAQQTAALTPNQALEVIPQICDALQYAHDQGVVHRDIKPENVLLDRAGRVKVADFGLSKLLGRTPVNVTLTASHQVMGTLHYMAPEQMQRPLDVDHRADIYSLGVVFYEMLTGEVPVGRYPLPSEKLHSDARLDDVVLKAMEREPDRRYQQASHVKTDVESLAAARAVSQQPPREDGRAARVAATSASSITEEEIEDARRQVQGPAIGLIVAGVLNLLPIVLLLVGLVFVRVLAHEAPRQSGSLVGAATAVSIAAVRFTPGWFEILVILFMLGLNFPAGLLMLIGGVKMRKLEAYGLSMTASIMGLLPGTVGCIVGLPVGVWSLLTLSRPEVKAAFGAARGDTTKPPRSEKPLTEHERSRVQRMVNGPAIGLIIVGCLHLLPFALAIVALPLSLAGWSSRSTVAMSAAPVVQATMLLGQQAEHAPVLLSMPFILPLLLGIPLSVVLILGGFRMRQLTLYGLAMVASVIAMLPFHLGFVVGLPVGIWSLAVLTRADVRAAFR